MVENFQDPLHDRLEITRLSGVGVYDLHPSPRDRELIYMNNFVVFAGRGVLKYFSERTFPGGGVYDLHP